MFIISVTYKKPLEAVDEFLAEHRRFLDEGYKKNFFVTSGPKNPRTGGIIISQLKNREELDTLLKQDPFYIHDVADYEVVEFSPIKYHDNFISFIEA